MAFEVGGGVTWTYKVIYSGGESLKQATTDTKGLQKAIKEVEQAQKDGIVSLKESVKQHKQYYKDLYDAAFQSSQQIKKNFIENTTAARTYVKELRDGVRASQGFGGVQAYVQSVGSGQQDWKNLLSNQFNVVGSTKAVTKAVKEDISAQNEKKDVNQQLGGSYLALSRILAIVGAAFAALRIKQLAEESAILASRTDQLQLVIEHVGARTGYTAGGVRLLENSLKDLNVTTLAARQSLAFLEQSGLNLSNSIDLQKVAMDAAAVSGLGLDEALERIVISIQRQNTWGLRSLGLFVNLRQIYSDYAKETGRTTAELTAQEKQQLELNAVLEKGKLNLGAFNATLGTNATQMMILKKDWEEAKRILGEVLQPILKGVISSFQFFVSVMKESPAAVAALAAGVSTLAVSITALGTYLLVLRAVGVKTFAELTKAIWGFLAANPEILIFVAALTGVIATLEYFNAKEEERRRLQEERLVNAKAEVDRSIELQEAYKLLVFYQSQLAQGVKLTTEQQKEMNSTMRLAIDLAGSESSALQSLTGNIEAFASKLGSIPGVQDSDDVRAFKINKQISDLQAEWQVIQNKKDDRSAFGTLPTFGELDRQTEIEDQIKVLNATKEEVAQAHQSHLARIAVGWLQAQDKVDRAMDGIDKDLRAGRDKLLGSSAEIVQGYEKLLKELKELSGGPKLPGGGEITAADADKVFDAKKKNDTIQALIDKQKELNALGNQASPETTNEINQRYTSRINAIAFDTDKEKSNFLKELAEKPEKIAQSIKIFKDNIDEVRNSTRGLNDELSSMQSGGNSEESRLVREIDGYAEKRKLLQEAFDSQKDQNALGKEALDAELRKLDVEKEISEEKLKQVKSAEQEKLLRSLESVENELDGIDKKQTEIYDKRMKLEGTWRDNSLEGIRSIIKEWERGGQEVDKFIREQTRLLKDEQTKGLSELEGVTDRFLDAMQKAQTPEQVKSLMNLLPDRLAEEIEKSTKDLETLGKKLFDIRDKMQLDIQQARYAVSGLVHKGMSVQQARALVETHLSRSWYPLRKESADIHKKMADEDIRKIKLTDDIPEENKKLKDAADTRLKELKDQGDLHQREEVAKQKMLGLQDQELDKLRKKRDLVLETLKLEQLELQLQRDKELGHRPDWTESEIQKQRDKITADQKRELLAKANALQIQGPLAQFARGAVVGFAIHKDIVADPNNPFNDWNRQLATRNHKEDQKPIAGRNLFEAIFGKDINHAFAMKENQERISSRDSNKELGKILTDVLKGSSGGLSTVGSGILKAVTGGKSFSSAFESEKQQLQEFANDVKSAFETAAAAALNNKTAINQNCKEIKDAESQFQQEFETAGLYA